jgi:2,4-diaminopentanoate dehydrogenase
VSGADRTYRVVQWATGNIGRRSLRAVLEHPALTLAGVRVHGEAKAGRDAGELCGVGPTGVLATTDEAEVLALGADCVLYMPLLCDVDEVCRLLASGANVVTTCTDFVRPASLAPEVRARLEAACTAGGTSLHSTGSSPGFISEAVPLVLTSVQRRLDRLAIEESADLSSRDSPELLFGLMGFGAPPAEVDARRVAHLKSSFGPSLELVADALGLPLDGVEATGEVAVASRAVTIAAGPLEAGTVAGQRTTIAGIRDGRTLISFRATWYCTDQLEPAWEVRPNGWHVVVEGDAPLEVDIRLAVPAERMAETTPGYTAHRAVNAVPYVCDAAPGLRSTVDLPTIVARLG